MVHVCNGLAEQIILIVRYIKLCNTILLPFQYNYICNSYIIVWMNNSEFLSEFRV